MLTEWPKCVMATLLRGLTQLADSPRGVYVETSMARQSSTVDFLLIRHQRPLPNPPICHQLLVFDFAKIDWKLGKAGMGSGGIVKILRGRGVDLPGGSFRVDRAFLAYRVRPRSSADCC